MGQIITSSVSSLSVRTLMVSFGHNFTQLRQNLAQASGTWNKIPFTPNWHLHNAFSVGVLKHFSDVVCGLITMVNSLNDVSWWLPTSECQKRIKALKGVWPVSRDPVKFVPMLKKSACLEFLPLMFLHYNTQVKVNWPAYQESGCQCQWDGLHAISHCTANQALAATARWLDRTTTMMIMTAANVSQFNDNCRYTECLDCDVSCRRMQQTTVKDFLNHSDQSCRPRHRTQNHQGRGRGENAEIEVKAATLLLWMAKTIWFDWSQNEKNIIRTALIVVVWKWYCVSVCVCLLCVAAWPVSAHEPFNTEEKEAQKTQKRRHRSTW